ncbi:hypothetical protein M9194_13845 [Vibrio sp. S4M6]|uniref:type VI secretion protein IcmF/TssM N-terminal domain-containing protein n=1 Tax=Vibrio sinus TaxID=2946865 RepID=UPI00202A9E24|nr:type VI secretion protein IcmF/TssM N-terminal domain-containing protein [Vibrio sinus]MCL9782513.1 hypothetical protein [Vibrio sinus]
MSGSKRKWLWTTLKLILLLVLVAAVSAAVFFWVEYEHWPWWAGAVILSGIAAIVCAIYLLRRYILRYKERKFVEHVVKHDKDAIETSQWAMRQRCRELEARWTKALAQLKSSKLKRQGHPFYVLPWYLVIGEEASGKSTILENCGLSSVLSPLKEPSGHSTAHCDWWFFEQGIFLDTAGKYLSDGDGHSEAEWKHLLTLLAQARRREPLNGLLVSLSVSDLLNLDANALQNKGRQLRLKLDTLMKVMGAQIPVYLMLTKCDQIYGFEDFANELEMSKREALFGCMNDNKYLSPQQMVSKALTHISDQLLTHQLEQLQGLSPLPAHTLLLAREIENLRDALVNYVDSAFGETPYHESIYFRGLSLSSALSKATPLPTVIPSLAAKSDEHAVLASHHAPTTIIEGAQPVVISSGNNSALSDESEGNKAHLKGLFLNELFSRWLPGDRHAYEFSHPFMQWRKWTGNLSVTLLLLIMFFAVGGMSLDYIQTHESYVMLTQNMQRVRALSGQLDATPTYEQIEQQKETLQNLQVAIHRSERSHQLLSKLGLDLWIGKGLNLAKHEYVKAYQDYLLQDIDPPLYQQITGEGQPSMNSAGNGIDYLAWRISRIQAKLGMSNNALLPLQGHTDNSGYSFNPLAFVSQMDSQQMFIDYVNWNKDSSALKQLLSQSQHNLQLALIRHPLSTWLNQWIENSSQVQSVTAASFWQAGLNGSDISVPGSFTLAGKKFVDNFLTQLQDSGNATVTAQIERYKNEYIRQYVSRWLQFYQQFPSSAKGLSIADRVQIANQMPYQNNPFSQVQKTTLRELKGLGDAVSSSTWQSLFLSQAIETKFWNGKEKKGLLSKGSQLLDDNASKLSSDDPAFNQKLSKGLSLYANYQDALSQILDHISNQSTAFQSISALFVSPNSGSPELKASNTANRLKQLLHSNGAYANGGAIYSDAFEFMLQTGIQLAANQLQSDWEAQVYGPLQYLSNQERKRKLFSPNGLLNNFIHGPGKGFIKMGAQGWTPASFMGVHLPFARGFFSFIDQSEYLKQDLKDDYKVTVEAMPMGVNPDADNHPYESELVLSCSDKQQQLMNYNYAQSQLFDWKPASCGQTKLTIRFNGFELNKTYAGANGFQDFLTQFRNGAVTFVPKDFPISQQILEQNHVSWLRIQYRFQGNLPIVALKTQDKFKVPLKIVSL